MNTTWRNVLNKIVDKLKKKRYNTRREVQQSLILPGKENKKQQENKTGLNNFVEWTRHSAILVLL